jgi:hypothetical protein
MIAPMRSIHSRCGCFFVVAAVLSCGIAAGQPTIDVVHAFPSLGALQPVGPLYERRTA